jgi:hypothetical protein
MAMFKEERLKAALKMIRVTPSNYNELNVDMILQCYEVIAAAEKEIEGRKETDSAFQSQ